MIVRLLTVASLVILSIELLFVFISVIFKNRSERIAFIRGFKKGKFTIIYLTAIPLYCIGRVYSGQNGISSFFDSVNDVINLVVLKYDTSSIRALMEADDLYSFAIYFTFILVGLNAIIFTISLINQYIWCAYESFKANTTKRDKLFLFGNNPENVSIYLSDKKRNKLIIDDISEKEGEKLYIDGISYISSPSYETPLRNLFNLAKKFDREYIVVVNTGDDDKNISICRSIIGEVSSLDEDIKKRLFLKTKVFVFGNPRYETIYDDIVSDAFGVIHYINKYQKIAIDFIDKYPLSKFLDEEQVDYKTSLLKEDVDINMILVGFGKTNRQLFLTSVANNQFLTKTNKGVELKKVKYFIFDKDTTEKNKNLNHNYYRFKHECSNLNPDDYLPLPTLPAEEIYAHLDINDGEFYDNLKRILTRNKKDANFIVISFGSDLENIDFAKKLIGKKKEWSLDNLVIFVKVRTWRKEQTPLENENCYFIGNESEVVYNVDKITSDKMFRMAQMRNEVYDLEYDVTQGEKTDLSEEYVKENHDRSYKNWYIKKSQMERESSVYCCLSLRSKLNLMGLDYVEADTQGITELSEEEYLRIYAGDDMPDRSKYTVTVLGKPIVYYSLNFPSSRRKNMAIHEHQRWNSFMITKGMIPSSREQISTEKVTGTDGKERYTNGKNYAVRRHGNLTTFDGLVEFRQIIAQRDKCSEEKTDVIKYDYQLLDDAYWLLRASGFKIVPKNSI